MSIFHLYILFHNETTHERIKKTWSLRGHNPYDRGTFYENCWETVTEIESPERFDLKERGDLTSLVITKSPKQLYFSSLELKTLVTDENRPKKESDSGLSELHVVPEASYTLEKTREGLSPLPNLRS